jgi:hypothetical protein
MSEQDLHATETHHAEEILHVVLLANHQSTEVMQPSEEPFHSPQGTAILSGWLSRREREAHFGELVQLDGSFHDWLEGRGPKLRVLPAFFGEVGS